MSKYALAILIGFSFASGAVQAQALRGGLGDASTIVNPDKTLTSTGNPNAIGNFSGGMSQQDTGEFETRHLRGGESSGIGGSFIGTTNVTAESSPARTGRIPFSAVRALIPTAGMSTFENRLFSEGMTRPASSALPVAGPDVSRAWNSGVTNFGALDSSGGFSSSTIDFFAGHKSSPVPKLLPTTLGVPSLDSF